MSNSFDRLKKLRQTPEPRPQSSDRPDKLISKSKPSQHLSWKALMTKLKLPSKKPLLKVAITFMLIALIGMAVSSYLDYARAKHPKIWADYPLTNFGKVTVHLKTSYKDNQVYYHMLIQPVTKLSAVMEKHPYATNKGFGLELYDKDGFKIYSNQMNLAEFTSIVDDNGKTEAYDINSRFPLSLDAYKSIVRYAITYRLGD